MAAYALDANTLIYLLRGMIPLGKIENEIYKGNQIIIPSLACYEVLRHLRYLNASRRIRDFEGLVKKGALAFMDKESLDMAVSIYAELKQRSLTIPDIDILVAAIARSKGMALVTNDAHFGYIEHLKLENWLPAED